MKHKEWILDLAALDQLEASLERRPNSRYAKWVRRYIELAKRAIQKRRALHVINDRIEKVVNKIKEMDGMG